MPVPNNKANRLFLAGLVVDQCEPPAVNSMAMRWLITTWKSEEGRQAFQNDAKAYAQMCPDDAWVPEIDEEDMPRYRCRECKYEDIEVLVWQNCNSEKVKGFEVGQNQFFCRSCHDRTGEGEIKYPEIFNLVTRVWE